MDDRAQLEQAITALEAQRSLLGDAVVDIAIAPLRQKIAALGAAAEPAPPPAPVQEQQRKLATILFADVSGFTAMSETMDAEDVAATFNQLWERLDGAITALGGHIDKHMGDAVMAIFGTPVAREDDTERAVRAALAMQAELTAFAALQPTSATVLRMRIGINTGHLLLGNMGTTGEYTAMGDTVNLASRLEHAAPVGGILISHDTYRHVRGVFDVEALEPIMVKGKREPVRVYVVTGVKPHSFRTATRGVEGVETRMVGRARELATLQEAVNRAEELQRPQLVTVVAEAGTGKSRLLYELYNWIELRPARTRMFKGRATQENRNQPFSLARDVFASRFSILETDPAPDVRRKIEEGFVEFLGDGAIAKAHFVGQLVGFDFSASPHLEGILSDAKQVREQAMHYAAQFFKAAVSEGSGLMLLEDVHWADEASMELVEHVVAEVGKCPLTVVAATRPGFLERRPTWEAVAPHVRLDLVRLTPEETGTLAREILQHAPLVPDRLVELIVRRAEGNPFFVEELVKMLIDDGTILPSEESWEIAFSHMDETRVPETLTGVIQARLDALPIAERMTLQQAAVAGRRFTDQVLFRLHQPTQAVRAPAEITHCLGGLVAKEIVYRSEDTSVASGHDFIFKSAILHDVVYESILKRERRSYHGQVANAVIELSADRAGEHSTTIAEHFELAEEPGEAATWFSRAARQAKDTYTPEVAIRLYLRALDLWGMGDESDRPEVREALWHLGQLFETQARFEDGLQVFAQLLELAEKHYDETSRARAWTGTALIRSRQGDHAGAIEAAESAEKIASTIEDAAELLASLSVKARSKLSLGQSDAVIEIAEDTLRLANASGNEIARVRSLNLIGVAHYMRGDFEGAEQRWGLALEDCLRVADRNQEIQLLNNLSLIAEERRDFAGALRRYEEALVTAQEIGNRNMEVLLLNNIGSAQLSLGDPAAAEKNLRLSLLMAETAGRADVGGTLSYLAEACARQGKLEDAVRCGQRALAAAETEGSALFAIEAWRTLGIVASYLGAELSPREGEAPMDANAFFRESEREAIEAEMEGELLHTLKAWALHHLEREDSVRGDEIWVRAEELAQRLGVELGVRPGVSAAVAGR